MFYQKTKLWAKVMCGALALLCNFSLFAIELPLKEARFKPLENGFLVFGQHAERKLTTFQVYQMTDRMEVLREYSLELPELKSLSTAPIVEDYNGYYTFTLNNGSILKPAGCLIRLGHDLEEILVTKVSNDDHKYWLEILDKRPRDNYIKPMANSIKKGKEYSYQLGEFMVECLYKDNYIIGGGLSNYNRFLHQDDSELRFSKISKEESWTAYELRNQISLEEVGNIRNHAYYHGGENKVFLYLKTAKGNEDHHWLFYLDLQQEEVIFKTRIMLDKAEELSFLTKAAWNPVTQSLFMFGICSRSEEGAEQVLMQYSATGKKVSEQLLNLEPVISFQKKVDEFYIGRKFGFNEDGSGFLVAEHVAIFPPVTPRPGEISLAQQTYTGIAVLNFNRHGELFEKNTYTYPVFAEKKSAKSIEGDPSLMVGEGYFLVSNDDNRKIYMDLFSIKGAHLENEDLGHFIYCIRYLTGKQSYIPLAMKNGQWEAGKETFGDPKAKQIYHQYTEKGWLQITCFKKYVDIVQMVN